MKNILIGLLYSIINRLLDKDVINSIREFIVRFSTEQIDGYLKKQKVSDSVRAQVGNSLTGVENYIFSMAIDIIYAYLRTKNEIK